MPKRNNNSREFRGGCWFGFPVTRRAAVRSGYAPGYRVDDLGGRLFITRQGAGYAAIR